MCGIVGVFSSREEYLNEKFLNNMSSKLIHRGPDAKGLWLDLNDGIGMAHRRLSILDITESGSQPMFSSDKRYVISFNGEIYNFLDIRKELNKVFNINNWEGNSDTEVLLKSIQYFGLEKSLNKIEGMFAFALWDSKLKKLTLVRDRMGEKPLYFGKVGQYFLFASELKALTSFPLWEGEIDRDSVALYLRQNFIPAPRTIYKGIFKLEPAHLIVISEKSNFIGSPKCYWDLSDISYNSQSMKNNDYAQNIEIFYDLIRNSVKKRLISDVPVGAFLSGGFDSSLVVSMMSEISNSSVKTFSIGFNNEKFNEANKAKEISNYLGTEHQELYLSFKDVFTLIQEIPNIYDEPFSDSSQLPTLLVSKLASKNVKVCLSGDGGDELFGGYNRHIMGPKVWNLINMIPYSLRSKFNGNEYLYINSYFDILNKFLPSSHRIDNFSEKLSKLIFLIDSKDSTIFYKNLISNSKFPENLLSKNIMPQTILDDYKLEKHFKSFAERIMYLDQINYLPNDILTKVDRASMSTSLEARLPFLDHKLVEFSWTIPKDQKIVGSKGKWILRQLLYKYIPQEIIDGPKKGFAIPLNDWLKGPLRLWADDLLMDLNLGNQEIFDRKAVISLWNNFLNGKNFNHHQLWNILMFQLWLKENSK